MDVMSVAIPRQVGLYVRRAREARGMTRRRLADKAGVSERLVASLELGDATGIRLDKLMAVLDALKLSLLVQGEGISPEVVDPARALYAEHTASPPAVQSVAPGKPVSPCDVSEASRIQQPNGYDDLLRMFLQREAGLDAGLDAEAAMPHTACAPTSDKSSGTAGVPTT